MSAPVSTLPTLPRLTTQETGVSVIPTSSTAPSMVRRSSSKTFINEGAGQPKGLSKSWDERLTRTANGGRPLPRLNPLQPQRLGRTVTLETTDTHYQNDLRSLVMKREQYHKSHNRWMKPFYGSKVEQEDYRKNTREILKSQMSDRESTYRRYLLERMEESDRAIGYDRKCLEEDHVAFQKKSAFLQQFRDENKRLMELKEQQKKLSRLHTNQSEGELLRYNPINWSQTLR
ncbi:uncharacterized protein LOC119732507 [Patiria miniata]|uniref:Uncharacterized protein n=1 Tax=Patiria miniata TaxID=46514 RepID=A0A914AE13_PATMI|nr:uncharacterized protein LOC119732507 [Patiria miniata]